jgi:hypothetical protein
MMAEYGKKLQITLITDHGNRDEFDHFVKMIVWTAAIDGKYVLRHHFNLDVDKGGHTTAAAANAIHKSLLPLHLDEVDVEFSFICGDSGGGAKVQLLYPTLKQLGVLCMLSDFVNCILHAFNLSYEHACKDALGDQGMNRCTVFQMCYLAVLMLKIMKKQTNVETLKQIYAKMMTQAILNDRYREASNDNFI